MQTAMQTIYKFSGQEPEFQAEGEVVYSVFGDRGRLTQEKRLISKGPFVVARKGRLWKIRITNLDCEDPFFEEMGFDGMAIYKLHQYDEEILRQRLGDSKNRISASGRIFPCSHLLGMAGELLFPVWLAFCSSDYFSTRRDERIVSPGFLLETFSRRPVPLHVLMPAKWKWEGHAFVSRIDWFSEGKELGFSDSGGVEIQSYPPPFDRGGFLYGSFETTKWTEFSGMKLPGGFRLDVFAPNQMQLHPDPTQGELCKTWSLEATVNAVGPLKNFFCLPELTRVTSMTDGRFRDDRYPGGSLRYESHAWLTEEAIEAKNKKFGVICEKQIPQD